MSQITPISETFQGTANSSVYNLLYPGIIQGPFSSNVLVNSVLQVAVTDYNILANTLIFYTGKPGANIVVQHYAEDNASINLTNLIELSLKTSSGSNTNGFGVVNVANQSDVLALSSNATLIMVAGEGLTITTNSALSHINLSATYLKNSDWVLRTPASNISWEAVTWSPRLNLFVAVSSNNTVVAGNARVMTSPDGLTWTARTAPNHVLYTSIVDNGNILCAVAATTGGANQVMISVDAVTWQGLPAASPGIQWRSVAWNGNIFCAVALTGVANSVMISTDGTSWSTRVPATDSGWRCVVWAQELGLFVATGSLFTGNRVMTSPDGTTWTSQTTPADNSWISVCWNGKLLVAVAFNGTNRVMTSPDGINWTLRYTPVLNQWTSVIWDGNQFVAVSNTGTSDRIMTSPDGINWSVRPSPQNCDWKGLAWNGQVLVAVGTAGNNNQVMTSTRDIIPVAGAGLTFTANSLANTLSLSVNVSNVTVGTLPVGRGGTGQTSYTNGQLLIGNTISGGLDAQTITQGTGIIITNGNGTITIDATGGAATDQYARDKANGAVQLGYPSLNVSANATLIAATGNNNTLILIAGTGIVLTPNAGNHSIAITATGGAATDQYARDKANGAVQLGYPRINVAANVTLVAATTNNDILVLVQGNGIVLVSNTANQSISISANISNTAPINYDSTTGVISHANTEVTPKRYGDGTFTLLLTVDAQGHTTNVHNVLIGIAASRVTSGILSVARGGTGLNVQAVTVNGGLLIGNTVNQGFDLNTIANTGTGGILVTNGQGTITLAANVLWVRGNVGAVAPITYTQSNGTFTHTGSGVTATGYGTATQIPVLVVNETGHLTSVTNTAIAGLDASVITTGRLVVARGGTGLSPTIVNGAILIGNTVNSGFDLNTIANTGSGGILITNGQGTITLAANVIWMRGNISATAPINYTAATGVVAHDTSGVTATGYGTATQIPVFVVNATGHVTLVTNTAIAGLDASVITTGRLAVARGGTGLTPTIVNGAILIGNTVNSGFDLNTIANTGTGGILITNGQGTITLAANVLWVRGNVGAVAPITYTQSNGNFTHDGSGVTATGYGSANTIPVLVVNQTGHTTSVVNTSTTMSATIHQQTMSRVALGF